MNRDDFHLLKNNIIYFDNGATTLKPYVLKEALKRMKDAGISYNMTKDLANSL